MIQGSIELALPLVLYMVALIAVGLISGIIGKKKKTAGATVDEEYYLGGRSVNGVVIAFTTVATVLSAGTVIGVAGVAYNTGFNWVYVALGLQVALGFVNIGCLGKRWGIVGRRIQAVTILDFLKARYRNNAIVIIGAISIIAFMGTYMMAQLQGGATVLESVTGLDYKIGLIIFATVMLIYLIIGGFKAVVNTDTFQGIFMIVGAIALWMFGLNQVGGFEGLTKSLVAIDPDLVTIPGIQGRGNTMMAITYFVHIAFCMVVVPPAATRAMSYPTSKDMHKAVSVGAIIGFIISVSYGFFALVTRVLLPELPRGDLAVPQLYQFLFNPWVAGILLAAPFAAMITTVDSLLLSLASTIAKDVYKNYIKKNATDKQMAVVNYASLVIILALFVVIALDPPDAVQWIVQFGLGGIGSAFAVPLIGGLFWKRATWQGALAGMISGIAFFMLTTVLTTWNLMKQTPAMLVGLIVFVAVSYATKPSDKDILELFWGRYPLKSLGNGDK